VIDRRIEGPLEACGPRRLCRPTQTLAAIARGICSIITTTNAFHQTRASGTEFRVRTADEGVLPNEKAFEEIPGNIVAPPSFLSIEMLLDGLAAEDAPGPALDRYMRHVRHR